MRIKDLFENKNIDFSEFSDSDKGLLYNLAEDLIYFMNHDDDTYRRHVYPSLVKCLDSIKKESKVNSLMFKDTAVNSYKNYRKQYPVKGLPQELDEPTLKEVCDKFYEEICKHKEEGRYD